MSFFVVVAEFLETLGINVSPELLQGIAFAILGLMVLVLLVNVGRAAIEVAKTVARFVRQQIDKKFWRDAGKLATLISFLLLVLAYGLYWQEQTRTLDEALLDLGREQLAEIVPTAILTQVVLLCAYWLIFGRLTGVPGRTLLQPFGMFLGFALTFAWLILASVVPFLLADGDVETLGMTILVMITVFTLFIPLFSKVTVRLGQQGSSKGLMTVVAVAILMLTSLVATTVACIYAGVSSDPSVSGLVATDFAIMTVLLLVTCYRFRAYIGEAPVNKSIPHLIDFSLAISACAIALTSLPGSEVSLGGIPPVVIAAGPALIVAAMVFIIHLRQSSSDTPRWRVCLIVAVIGGLLVGPLKALLASPIAAFAELLPINWS